MGVKRPKPSGEKYSSCSANSTIIVKVFFLQILFRKQLILHKWPSMEWVDGWFEVVQQKTVKDYFGSDSSNQSIINLDYPILYVLYGNKELLLSH